MKNAMQQPKTGFAAKSGRIALKAGLLLVEPIVRVFGTTATFIADALPSPTEIIGRIGARDARRMANAHITKAQKLELEKDYYGASLAYADAYDVMSRAGIPKANRIHERMMLMAALAFSREGSWETKTGEKKGVEVPGLYERLDARLEGARQVYRSTVGMGKEPQVEKPSD